MKLEFEDDEEATRAPVIGCLVALGLTALAVVIGWLIVRFAFWGV